MIFWYNEDGDSMINREMVYKYAKLVMLMKNDKDYKFTDRDEELLIYMKDLMKNNPKFVNITERIISTGGDEAKIRELIDSCVDENEITNEENKTEEEQISEVFNVPLHEIEHLYLNGGKKIFHFYSVDLGRDVVLENTNKGKSLTDVLEELRQSTDVEDENQDSKGDLIEEAKRNNLEMEMYLPNEIANNKDLIGSLSDSDLELLSYLVQNADQLNIKLINVDNLFYITNDHKIKEVSYDANYKPVVSSPEGEDGMDSNSVSNEEVVDDNSDLGNMFSQDDDLEKENEYENSKEKENKQLVRKIDNYQENGFGNNYIFIFAAILIIIIFILLFIVMRW